MTEIGFYHLTRSSLEHALARLLAKVLESSQRALVRLEDDSRLQVLDRALWTDDKESFLPHATMRDPKPERQPVLLTTRGGNPNGAQVLILVGNAAADDAASFARCLEIFDGRDPEAVSQARQRWRWAGEQGLERVYWQQDEGGRWRRADAA